MLNCISGVDYLEPDPKKAAKAGFEPHLEVVYHLSSFTHRHRFVVKVILPRWKDDKPGELPEVPSVTSIWRAADWHEREVYDLCGIWFTGHPDLTRILLSEDWDRPSAAQGLRVSAGVPRHPGTMNAIRRDVELRSDPRSRCVLRSALLAVDTSDRSLMATATLRPRPDHHRVRRPHRRDARQHGAAAPQHARRAAARAADRRRGHLRSHAAPRLPAPLRREDRRERHADPVHPVHRPDGLPGRR